MSKHINAGDTLTVGDLTDDYLGAVIEVGPEEGIITRMRLENVGRGNLVDTLFSDDGGVYQHSQGQSCQGHHPASGGEAGRTHDPRAVHPHRGSP